MSDPLGMLLGGAVVVALLAAAEGLRVLGWSPEATRKFAHVACGLWILAFPALFSSPHSVGVLAGGFAILLMVTRPLGLLRSIHAVERVGWGAVWYPAGVYVAALLTWPVPALFRTSILLLAIGDGLAALVGQRFGAHPYAIGPHTRTVEGSLTVLVVSVIAVAVGLAGRLPWADALLVGGVVGLLVMVIEGLAPWGTDNVLVPAVGAAVLVHYADADPALIRNDALAACLAALIAATAWWRKNLSASGALAGWLLGFAVATAGGWPAFTGLVTMFVGVNVASRIGKGKKRLEGKGSTRDHVQVFANAGVGGVMALAWGLSGDPVYLWGFMGALGMAGADTLASEVGVLARRPPVSITTLRPVAPGTSGGVSFEGYAAAVVGGLLTPAGFWLASGPLSLGLLTAGLVGGLVACTADSLLGDIWQVRYQCATCRAPTEDAVHCATATAQVGGVAWLDNDAVNLLGSLVGAATGMALHALA